MQPISVVPQSPVVDGSNSSPRQFGMTAEERQVRATRASTAFSVASTEGFQGRKASHVSVLKRRMEEQSEGGSRTGSQAVVDEDRYVRQERSDVTHFNGTAQGPEVIDAGEIGSFPIAKEFPVDNDEFEEKDIDMFEVPEEESEVDEAEEDLRRKMAQSIFSGHKGEQTRSRAELLRMREAQRLKDFRDKQRYATRAFFILTRKNVLRRVFIRFIEWKWFDRIVLAGIILNCIFLALDDPTMTDEEKANDPLQVFLSFAETFFTIFFLLEMCCKIIAMGLVFERDTYLRSRDPSPIKLNWWNVLDFFIVCTSMINFIPGFSANVSGFRAFRALRPLRTITRLRGLQQLVTTLLNAIPQLGQVLSLCMFLFFVFGIVALQMWKGTFKYRCYDSSGALQDGGEEILCYKGEEKTFGNGFDTPFDRDVFGPGRKCETNNYCGDYHSNPNYNITSFDNIAVAFLTIFQCITLEGWVDVMYWTRQSSGYITAAYYLALIMFGSFFMLNLLVAVIKSKFDAAKEEIIAKASEKEMLSHQMQDNTEEDDLNWQDRTEYYWLHNGQSFVEDEENERDKLPFGYVGEPVDKKDVPDIFQLRSTQPGVDNSTEVEEVNFDGDHRDGIMAMPVLEDDGTLTTVTIKPGGVRTTTQVRVDGSKVTTTTQPNGASQITTFNIDGTTTTVHEDPPADIPTNLTSEGNSNNDLPRERSEGLPDPAKKHDANDVAGNELPLFPQELERGETPSLREKFVMYVRRRSQIFTKRPSVFKLKKKDPDAEPVEFVKQRFWCSCQRRLYNIVTWKWADRFFMALILLNTVLMASEHHDMVSWFETFLYVSNIILTQLFAIESILKLIAYGPRDFLRDGFNIFDFIIVALSEVEIIITIAAAGAGTGLSAFRTVRIFRLFRVMRIMKLVRYLSELKKILGVISSSIMSLVYIMLLLFLFMFIFAILGMQLFGGQFRGTGFEVDDFGSDVPRANFDNFYWAIITIFQILTGENWNTVMYDGMRTVGWYTCLYFVMWIVVGNYILLNLLLVIILDKFDDEDMIEEEEEEEEENAIELRKLALAEDEMVANNVGDKRRGDGNDPVEEIQTLDQLFDEPKKTNQTVDLANEPLTPRSEVKKVEKSAPEVKSDATMFVAEADSPTGSQKQLLKKTGSILGSNLSNNGSSANLKRSGSSATLKRSGSSANLKRSGSMASVTGTDNGMARRNSQGDIKSSYNLTEKIIAMSMRKQMEEEGTLDKPERRTSVASITHLKRTASQSTIHSDTSAPAEEDVAAQMSALEKLAVTKANILRGDDSSDDDEPVNLQSRAQLRNWKTAIRVIDEEGQVTKRMCDRGTIYIGVANIRGKFKPREPMARALLCLSPRNRFRTVMFNITFHKYFEWFILFLIMCSSISMAIEHPDVSDEVSTVFFALDVVYTFLFTVESVCKIISLGFVIGKETYLRGYWNLLDFFIVIVSIFSLALTDVELTFVRAFRLLRALRPLRVISRSRGMRVVVGSLFKSAFAILNVVLVCVLVWLIFGILGINLFAGKYYKCTGSVTLSQAECEAAGGKWEQPDANFDNIGIAFITLFEVASLEQYVLIMFNASDSPFEEGDAPSKNNQPWMCLYFVIFICLTTFFFINLFTGVVYSKYRKESLEDSGYGFYTPSQREWVDSQKMLLRSKPLPLPDPPRNRFRRMFYHVAVSPHFDRFIMTCILLNVAVMATSFDGEPSWYTALVEWVNLGFSTIFIFEAVIKLLGLGIRLYFKDPWNRFDFLIVCISLIDILTTAASFDVAFLTVLRVVGRIFRVTRMMRLVKALKGVRMLFKTLWITLPSLLNMGALLFLLLFIYSVLGMNLFGNVKYGDYLNSDANFERLGIGMITLFRIATGEDWNGIMHDCQNEDDCTGGEDTDCGNFFYASVYFPSYVIIVGFVVLNLFVSIILEGFDSIDKNENMLVNENHVGKFEKTWVKYDQKASLWLPMEDLPNLLKDVEPPLGIGKGATGAIVMRQLKKLDIPSHNNDGRLEVHYKEVLYAATKLAVGQRLPPSSVKRDIEHAFRKVMPSLQDGYSNLLSIGELYSVVQIQRQWRGKLERKRSRKLMQLKAKASHSLHRLAMEKQQGEPNESDNDDRDITQGTNQSHTN